MGKGFSWTGGGPTYPKLTGKPFWRDSHTCVLPVALEPGKFYSVGINSPSHKNFRSKDGTPAKTLPLTFTTAGLSAKDANALAPPKIVSIIPANGKPDVDPGLKEIVVTFDRDMGGGFSWTGGGPTYPKTTGKPFWRDSRTCVLPVALEPGKEYRFGINSPSHKNFRSKNGVPVQPVRISFSTSR